MQSVPGYNAVEEIAKGRQSAFKVMEECCDVGVAFRHPVLGHISLLYGDRNSGVRHILSRREREIADQPSLVGQIPSEVVFKLIEVVILGKLTRAGAKCLMEYDGYRAILGAPQGNQMNYWLISGYKLT